MLFIYHFQPSYLQDVEQHTRNHAGFKQFHNFKCHEYIEKTGEERGHAADGFQGLLYSSVEQHHSNATNPQSKLI